MKWFCLRTFHCSYFLGKGISNKILCDAVNIHSKAFAGRGVLCYLIESSLPLPPAVRGWICILYFVFCIFVFCILYFVFCILYFVFCICIWSPTQSDPIPQALLLQLRHRLPLEQLHHRRPLCPPPRRWSAPRFQNYPHCFAAQHLGQRASEFDDFFSPHHTGATFSSFAGKSALSKLLHRLQLVLTWYLGCQTPSWMTWAKLCFATKL